MWYEEENQLIRAPVPESFDLCVKKLEDEDRVLFESISLPSFSSLSKKSPEKNKRTASSNFQSGCSKSSEKKESIIIEDDFISDYNSESGFDDYEDELKPQPMPPLKKEKEKIKVVKTAKTSNHSINKTNELYQKIKHLEQVNLLKDQKIECLQKELQRLRQTRAKTERRTGISPPKDHMIMYYKTKYEKILEEYEKLKGVIGSDVRPRINNIKAARIVT